jgi:ParB family transcriptional regulator, chromosome partitioning protein
MRGHSLVVLHDAASIHKVDTDTIALKVKQEFAAKEKAKSAGKATPPVASKTKK